MFQVVEGGVAPPGDRELAGLGGGLCWSRDCMCWLPVSAGLVSGVGRLPPFGPCQGGFHEGSTGSWLD